jgi:hypothetical protein
MAGKRFVWILLLGITLLVLMLAGCAPAMEPEIAAEEPSVEEGEAIVETVIVEKEVEEVIVATPSAIVAEEPMEEEAPTNTPPPQPTLPPVSPTPAATLPVPTPTTIIEPRVVEVEWPQALHLGDSDVVRMALIPTKGGYSISTEFPDHKTITQDVPVIRPEGYELYGVGRLNGVGFTIAPSGEQVRSLPLDESVIWHWSLTPQQPGRQRITVTLLLRWVPATGSTGTTREAVAYSKGLEIRVRSFFGLTRRQAMTTGLVGAVFGGGLSMYALVTRPTRMRRKGKRPVATLTTLDPNPKLVIECPSDIQLSPHENSLLKSLFARYARLVLQSEFLSGYSGARTFLLLPIRIDGRSDAYTIAKIGDRTSIQREYQNYEAFVKHTLPPVTARIQNPPISVRGNPNAVIQYTFIGEAGSLPTSLRQALLKAANPDLLSRLFETFGPNWWMQRTPYTFRLAEEYDRVLPPHYLVEPAVGKGYRIDGQPSPAKTQLSTGDHIELHDFTIAERRHDGISYDVRWESLPGHPPLKIRWLGEDLPKHPAGSVIATRDDLLRSYVAGFDLFGLPDPLDQLSRLLEESVIGTRSIIHGDLNLENVLVGPGNIVWLIDFATTREGHPMFDFSHLEVEIISHVIAPQVSTGEYLELLKSQSHTIQGRGIKVSSEMSMDLERLAPKSKLLLTLTETARDFAMKCLSNPSRPLEYTLALTISCLGALKYQNLDVHQKHLLYLTAANLLSKTENQDIVSIPH